MPETLLVGRFEAIPIVVEPQTQTAGAAGKPPGRSRIGRGIFDRGGDDGDIPPAFRNAFGHNQPQRTPEPELSGAAIDGELIMAFHAMDPRDLAEIVDPILTKYGLNETAPIRKVNHRRMDEFMARAGSAGLIKGYNTPVLGGIRFQVGRLRRRLTC